MLIGERKRQKEELISFELDILTHIKSKFRVSGYIRRIFCFLREHIELCENPDYQRLYDECLYYLILDAHVRKEWTKSKPKNQKAWIELLADLENENADKDSFGFTQEEIEAYLEYRKNRWN